MSTEGEHMKTTKKYLAIRIDADVMDRFKAKLEKEGRQQTTVATRLIEGWVSGKLKV